MEGKVTLILALFIILAKFVVAGCKKIKLPPVIGLIFLGLICGHSGLDLAKSHDTILQIETFAEIGVVILLFLVGLETDIEQLRKMGKNSFLIAVGGVFIPFFCGFALIYLFSGNLEKSLILGSVLTATSVSVSVLTFSDMNRLSSVEAKTVVTSAIIDDVIAIIFLSILLGIIGVGNQSFSITILKIIIYFVGAIALGLFLIPFLIKLAEKSKVPHGIITLSFGLMLIYAWVAHQANLASITGAYICGVFLARSKHRNLIIHSTEIIGNTLFIPIFFINIGMNIYLGHQTVSFIILLFFIMFALTGVISKIVGCGAIAKLVGFDWSRSFVIGSGMVPRGEVALVIVSLASSGNRNILNAIDKAGVIILVLISAILTPLLIKWGFSRMTKKEKELVNA